MKNIALMISCEHAVNTVPQEYLPLFAPFQALLSTHRGVDFGALEIAQYLTQKCSCPFIQATATRLLVDCNRSIHHPHCFSEVTHQLSHTEQEKIINQYYLPFRQQIINHITHAVAQGKQVWHLSIHSFTPIMNEIVRNADIGLLYDPRRATEKNLAKQWQKEIKKQQPAYTVRMNYPYRGVSDGLTSALRKQFSDDEYVGIEVETNQKLTTKTNTLNILKHSLGQSLFTTSANSI